MIAAATSRDPSTNQQLPSSDSDDDDDLPKFWIQSTQAKLFFGAWIILNALVLAIETELRNETNSEHVTWFVLDSTFNLIFLIEIFMHVYADRCSCLNDAWKVFDCFLVSMGILDTWVLPFTDYPVDMRIVTALRTLKLLKLLRLLRVFRLCKELMLILLGVASAMRAMIWGFLLLAITIFMCSLAITQLVGQIENLKDPFYNEYFGNIFRTAFTLLQFTMEFQPDVCRTTWQDGFALTVFFILYTFFTNVTVLNIIASIIVDTILNISRRLSEEDAVVKRVEQDRKDRDVLQASFIAADTNGNGVLELHELSGPRRSGFSRALESSGVDIMSAKELFEVLDADESGKVSLDEFTDGLMRVRKPPQAKHLLQIERRLVAMDIKVRTSMAELVSLLSKTVDATSQQQHGHQALLQKVQGEEFHEVLQDMGQEVLTILQTEMQAWRRDLRSQMEAYQSRIWEDLIAKHLHRTSLPTHGVELPGSSCAADTTRRKTLQCRDYGGTDVTRV